MGPLNPFRGNAITCPCQPGSASKSLYTSKSVNFPVALEAELTSLLHKTFTFYDRDTILSAQCADAPHMCSDGTCHDCNAPFVYSSEDKFPELCPGAASESCYCYTHFPDNQPVCTERHIMCSSLKACPKGDGDCPSGQKCTYKTGCQALWGHGPLCSPACGTGL